MNRRIVIGVLANLLVAIVALSRAGAASGAGPDCWAPPVDAPVSDPYRAPGCLWCAGNRGIEFNSGPGVPVTAVASGTVSFAGSVAGTGYVVVRHADGRRATYGNVGSTGLAEGDPVVAGMVVAVTHGRLHFGLRDGDHYIDPTPFLGRWMSRVRLVPVDGRPPRPAPPPELVCGSVSPMALPR